ncbi:MAG TPA: hypothetical protein VGA96_03135 [Fibrella sp.]
MIKKPIYATLGYALFTFLISRFFTDQELPLNKLLFEVGLSSLGMFFYFNWMLKDKKPASRRDR